VWLKIQKKMLSKYTLDPSILLELKSDTELIHPQYLYSLTKLVVTPIMGILEVRKLFGHEEQHQKQMVSTTVKYFTVLGLTAVT
jgi:hypothetical protein